MNGAAIFFLFGLPALIAATLEDKAPAPLLDEWEYKFRQSAEILDEIDRLTEGVDSTYSEQQLLEHHQKITALLNRHRETFPDPSVNNALARYVLPPTPRKD